MYPSLVLTYSRLTAGTYRILAGLHLLFEDHGSGMRQYELIVFLNSPF